MLITTEDAKGFLLNMSNSSIAGPIALAGRPTALRFFE